MSTRPNHHNNGDMDVANEAPALVGRGSGMTLKEIHRKLKDWFNAPKRRERAHFGWMKRADREAAQAEKMLDADVRDVKPVKGAIDLRGNQQHRIQSGPISLRKFQFKDPDPWKKL